VSSERSLNTAPHCPGGSLRVYAPSSERLSADVLRTRAKLSGTRRRRDIGTKRNKEASVDYLDARGRAGTVERCSRAFRVPTTYRARRSVPDRYADATHGDRDSPYRDWIVCLPLDERGLLVSDVRCSMAVVGIRPVGVESAHCLRLRVFRADRRLAGRESVADRPMQNYQLPKYKP
jgi:hypothetical protein